MRAPGTFVPYVWFGEDLGAWGDREKLSEMRREARAGTRPCRTMQDLESHGKEFGDLPESNGSN